VKNVLLATELVLKPDHHPETNAPAEWHYFEILTNSFELQRQSEHMNKRHLRHASLVLWVLSLLAPDFMVAQCHYLRHNRNSSN
jgi:hypothetical protein